MLFFFDSSLDHRILIIMLCLKCSVVINQENERFIKCDGCSRPIHVNCSELSPAELKCFDLRSNSKRKIKYICIECEQGVHQIPKLISMINDLKSELRELKSQITAPTQPSSSLSGVEEIMEEIAERNKRSFNVLVFGSVELGRTRKEQLEMDSALACDLMDSLDVSRDAVKPISVGKYDSTKSPRTRPIKMRMSCPDDVLRVIRKFKSLKSITRFSGISVGFDRTPNQIAYYRSVRTELDARVANGETNLSIRYRNNIPSIVRSEN